MFGMLDYRANKFFLILFGLPLFVLRWVVILGMPFASYFVGLHFSTERFFQVLISLLSVVMIDLLLSVILTHLGKFIMSFFSLIVDVIPSDGRTKEEAMRVVSGGERAILFINLNKKSPARWENEEIYQLASGFYNSFFKTKIIERIEKIRDYYATNPEITPSEYNTNKFLKENNIKLSLLEKIVTNDTYRGWAIAYSLVVYLLIFNPFH
jgi:hypothetical protein